MPNKIEWYIPDQILYIQYWGESTSEEIHECLMEMNNVVAQSSRTYVHVLTDVSQVTVPLSLVQVGKAVVGFKPGPNIGWSVTVGKQDKVVKFVSNVSQQIMHLQQASFDTVEEGLAFLQRMDSNVDWGQGNPSMLVH